MTARLRRAVADVPRDYGGVRLALLVVALFYAGARRLEHLRYLAGDQLIARFCGVARFPTAHTISNWLKQFTQATLAPVIQRPSATMGRRQMRKSITIATVWRYISHGLRGLTGPVRLLALAAAALLLALTPWFSAQVFAQTVVATIPVVSVNPSGPVAVGVNPATNRVYVGNFGGDTVSVIDGTTNTVVATIQVPGGPHGVGVNPATKRVYVANFNVSYVAVIDGTTNTVVATIPVGFAPRGVGVNPATNRVYVCTSRVCTSRGLNPT